MVDSSSRVLGSKRGWDLRAPSISSALEEGNSGGVCCLSGMDGPLQLPGVAESRGLTGCILQHSGI